MVSAPRTIVRSKALLAATSVGIALLVGLILPATLSVEALNQPEADTLASGGQLAESLATDKGFSERLKEGFQGVQGNPRVGRFKGNSAWMKKAVEPPLPRWVAGFAMSFGDGEASTVDNPEAWTGLDRARSLAALLVGLALALLFAYVAVVARRRPDDGFAYWTALAVVGLSLLLPGVTDAATGAGYGAILMLSSAVLVAGTHLTAAGRSGVWAGVGWGLCLACHGSALFFIVPVFAAIAAAHLQRQKRVDAAEAPMPAGHLRLPAVALSGFAIPLVGVALLWVLWPSLWQDSAKTLAVWLTDAYRLMEPEQRVAGYAFGQSSSKVPSGWVTLVQAGGWLPVTVLGLWCAGIIATARGAAEHWFAPMFTATLLIVGMTAGGLFFGRQSLLPMLWPPVLVTAAFGVKWAADSLGQRTQATWLQPAVALGAIAATALVNAVVPSNAPPGAGVLQPLPVAMLEHIASEREGTKVAVVGGAAGWGRPLTVVAKHAGLDIKPAAIHRADWVLVVKEKSVIDSTNPNWLKTLPKGEPEMEEMAGGLTFQAFKR